MSPPREAELVLRRYLPFIQGYFRARVTSTEDAEDLSQDAAVAVARSWPRFEHRAAPTTWIYAICRNTLWGYHRRRGRAPDCAPLEPESREQAERIDTLAVEMAMASAAPERRRLYELYYRQGCSVREISALLGKPEGTVKYELYALRGELRRKLL